MKIALVTSFSETTDEVVRIREEIEALNYHFEYVNVSDFSFHIDHKNLHADKLSMLREVDIVIVRGILNSIKSIAAIINNLRHKGVKVFDNNLSNHLYSIDKVTDLVKLSLAEIVTPITYYNRDFESYPRNAAQIGYPVIIKSTRAGKGMGVFKIEDKQELTGFVEGLVNEGKNAKSYLMQEFIPYVHDLRVLIIGSRTFVMKRIPGEGEFRANFSLGGEVEVFSLDKKGRDLAIKALKAVDMSVGGVDILITKDDKRYILEVNHSAGFAGMEKATGKNIGKVWVEHAIKAAK